MAAFPLGAALAAIEMQQPALARTVPISVGVIILIAGALQFTAWKAHQLACCREMSASDRASVAAGYRETWRYGVRLGIRCSCCCINLMTIVLLIGIMDRWTMAVVTAAITAERLAPAGERVARAIGTVIVGAGLFLVAQATGLG